MCRVTHWPRVDIKCAPMLAGANGAPLCSPLGGDGDGTARRPQLAENPTSPQRNAYLDPFGFNPTAVGNNAMEKSQKKEKSNGTFYVIAAKPNVRSSKNRPSLDPRTHARTVRRNMLNRSLRRGTATAMDKDPTGHWEALVGSCEGAAYHPSVRRGACDARLMQGSYMEDIRRFRACRVDVSFPALAIPLEGAMS